MATGWPEAPRPSEEVVAEREQILLAAAAGDYARVRVGLRHRDDRVRATTIATLAAAGQLADAELAAASNDDSARVRAAAAELGSLDDRVDLSRLLSDDTAAVVEIACWACGERGPGAAGVVPALATISGNHEDPLCREAAVAALGAIGDPAALPAILAATEDKATVRRRAIIALAPFDSPDVTSALRDALDDRDWQVRQAAEDLLAESH